MKECTLVVKDAVNVRFEGLDNPTKRKLQETLKFVVPSARHTPQYKLGRWDGTVSFCSSNAATHLNLLDRLLPIIDQAGYSIKLDDRRPLYEFHFPAVAEDMFADRVWPPGHLLEGQPVMLRDYQVAALQNFLANLQSVQELATGLGKTVLTAAMSSIVEPYGRSIIIVPNKSLVGQTEKDYQNLGLDVGVFYGDRKELGHTHTIATWQSLVSLLKRSRAGESEISMRDVVEDVICVIVDEAHAGKASQLRSLLTGAFAHVPIRWGLTGTIPKEEHEWMCLLAGLGPVVGKIRAAELQERGVLANCQVEIVQLIDDHVGFDSYDSEHKFLVTDRTRLNYIAKLVHEWSQTGNTLVLVDKIDSGKILQEQLPGAAFVYGKTKTSERVDEYNAVQTSEDKIIIATYGVAAVGINIPRIYNLVILEPGKSFVRTIQSIGRGLRKGQNKDAVRIVDLCSTLPYSKRHLTKRKEYYREASYPHSVQKVAYR